ncbi:MAG: FliA/WhiG family RNA polymerase sigma factor [Actinomycetota bacterium]|nr:FliA/WhiG family RNA polymerase sigma factor [Actinomycetota bacterium]
MTDARARPARDPDRAGVDALWDRYRSAGDPEAREALILFYSPVVKYVVGRVGAGLPRHVDREDLVSHGIFGLIDAIERFDPSRGFRFETFAVPRVRGAILDELRSLDWLPRTVRDQAKAVERAIGELSQELGRAPSDTELAEHLGISTERLGQVMVDSTAMGFASLDAVVPSSEDRSLTLADVVQDPHAVDLDARLQLREALEALPERERLIVSLYYYEGLKLAEIGEVLGLSESRICQLHGRAMKTLHQHLGDAG